MEKREEIKEIRVFRAYFENPLSSFKILEPLLQSLLIVLLLYNFCYKLLLIELLT
jgi:hypothetical protein